MAPRRAFRKRNRSHYRSGLEDVNAQVLDAHRVIYEYESLNVPYIKPSTQHKYKPDFIILRNGIIVETKGEFDSADRKKHLLVKEQHPDLDIRFVFSSSRKKIYKGSKTTCAAWCAKHGFMYAEKVIPTEWIKEKPNHKSINAIKELKA